MNWKGFLTTMGAVAAALIAFEIVKEPAKEGIKSLLGKGNGEGEEKK